MEYDSTKHLEFSKSYVRMKPYEWNNKGNILAMHKDNNISWTLIESTSPLCQICLATSVQKINLKLDHHTGGKWFIYSPKHRKENQLLSLKHYCWLSRD